MTDDKSPGETVSIKLDSRYDASHLRLIEGREHVLQRPAMYIGDVGSRGLHQLFFQILDDAIDTVLAGCATDIHVTIHEDRSVSVRDNGGGISLEVDEKTGLNGVELIMTRLNAYRQFNAEGYRFGHGLSGVGLACVNFLSSWCEVCVEQDGRAHLLRCEQGKTTGPLRDIGPTSKQGTTVRWLPDPEIFGEYEHRPDIFRMRIRSTCFLTPEATIHFHDLLNRSAPETHHCERGIADFVSSSVECSKSVGEMVHAREIREGVLVDFALQYTETDSSAIWSFANSIHTSNGGTHADGFRMGLKRAVTRHARGLGVLTGNDRTYAYSDLSAGLTAAVAIRHFRPYFEGATRARLGNEEVSGIVAGVVAEEVGRFLRDHPDFGRWIVEEAHAARHERRRPKIA